MQRDRSRLFLQLSEFGLPQEIVEIMNNKFYEGFALVGNYPFQHIGSSIKDLGS